MDQHDHTHLPSGEPGANLEPLEKLDGIPSSVTCISITLAIGLVTAKVSSLNHKVGIGSVLIWLALYIAILPTLIWASHQSRSTWYGQWKSIGGIASTVVGGLFIGIAANQFSIGMTESGLMQVLCVLILASFAALPAASFRWKRLLLFYLLAWGPFFYRLVAPDTDFNAYVLLSTFGSMVLVGAITWTIGGFVHYLLAERLERDHSARTLVEKQIELEKIQAEQHVFFLAANHDIRQPLQAATAYATALEQGFPEAQAHSRDLLRKLQNSIQTLGELIDETLRFAKIAAGEETPKLTIFPAQLVIDKLRAEYGPAARQKGVALRIRDSSLLLFTDQIIIERVLGNLLSNAIRYTEEGGVLVAFRKRQGKCLIQVFDTGIGIKQDEMNLVFDTFQQGSNRRVASLGSQKGYGLGLPIVKRLCTQIGADLALDSVEDRGTRVGFSVPVASGNVNHVPPRRVAATMRSIPNFTGVTIAVVDDDPAIRESLGAILASAHAMVILATGLQDLNAGLAGVDNLDFLIADLHIAGELGTNVVQSVRQRYPSVNAVILTGDANEATLRKLRQEGFRTVLKPIDPPILMRMIVDSLSDRRRMMRGDALN